jgi:tetratricopeptide (TPR) repeat protein
MAKKQASMFPVTESDLETLALSQFRCGKYKEASELYKKLLQGAENHAWRQQLADCYLQRALAFAEKRQYKDALVLWENYSRHVSPPYQYYDRYITWLILAKNPAATRTCLQQLSARQLDKEYPALAALLGLLIITEHPEFRPALPQDSAFTAHLQIVQQVLHSYRENDLGGLDAALKHLPYRSAFRDVRTLLKAYDAVL